MTHLPVLQAEEELERDRRRRERMQQRQEIVEGQVENLPTDLSETSLVTIKTTKSEDGICNGEELFEGTDSSHDRVKNGDAQQISLPTSVASVVESVSDDPNNHVVDCTASVPGTEAKVILLCSRNWFVT